MAGESPESICKRLKLTPEILDLFPDRLVDSELGEIPEGWETAPLSNLFEEIRERDVAGEYPEYSSTNDGLIPRDDLFKKQLSRSRSGNKIVRKGYFVFGLSRKVLNFGMMTDKMGAVSPAYRVFRLKHGIINEEMLYDYMRTNIDYCFQIVSSSSREGQSISLESLNSVSALLPEKMIQDYYRSLSRTIFEVSRHSDITLLRLRDTLLPKLISGEIRVPEVERFVKAAMDN